MHPLRHLSSGRPIKMPHLLNPCPSTSVTSLHVACFLSERHNPTERRFHGRRPMLKSPCSAFFQTVFASRQTPAVQEMQEIEQ